MTKYRRASARQNLFASGDTVLIGSVLSIYRSIDGGNSWEASGLYYKERFVGFSKIRSEIFACFDGLIQRSTDGGLSWQSVYAAADQFAAMTAVDTFLYGLYQGYPRLIRSGDGGRHWDKIDADILRDETDYSNFLLGRDSNVYLIVNTPCIRAIYRSENRGLTWSAPYPWVFNELPDWIKDARLFSSGLLIGSEAGAYFSQDFGGTFAASDAGINASTVLTLLQSGSRWWTQTRYGAFFSDDAGQSWATPFPATLSEYCDPPVAALGRTGKRLFYLNCTLLYSEDQGTHWDTLIVPGPNCPEIAFQKNAAYLLNDSSLFKFADTGTALEALQTPVGLHGFGFRIQADETRLFLEDNSGYKLFYSNDGGSVWDSIPALNEGGLDRGTGYPLYSDSTHVYRLFYKNYNQAVVGVWSFPESSWSILPLIDPVYGDTINGWDVRLFAGAGPLRLLGVNGRGLYYSTMPENIWYPFKPDFPANSPSAVFYNGNELWVGTAGSGIFRTTLEFKIPESPLLKFSLYPNPASGAALTLVSNLFLTESIRLRVFESTGRLVREEQLPPGQRWPLDGGGVAPGVYVFQCSSGKFSATVKWVKH